MKKLFFLAIGLTLRKDSGLESLSAIEHGYTFEAILLNIL